MSTNYNEFIEQKTKKINDFGFDIAENKLNKNLFDFQKFIVKKALKKGKYAIFADCGLGKTLMQLEWAYQVQKHTQKSVLILAPLAVVQQTIQEGAKFDIFVKDYQYFDKQGVYITNYENLKNVNTSLFQGIVLDESSILKNFESTTKKTIIDLFQKTPFKLACTATPAPNDTTELANHCEFLNIMKRSEMLATYFTHDGGNTSSWVLKGHAKIEFWKFVCQWAVIIDKPCTLGFDVKGYNLPQIEYIEHIVNVDLKKQALFNDASVNATDLHKDLRMTAKDRLTKVLQIVAENKDKQVIVWALGNEEATLLQKNIKGSVNVQGSDSAEFKKNALNDFANGKIQILITKPKIASMGMNFQNCCTHIFAGLDFSFERFYQCVRRSYRFGQKNKVDIHIITTNTQTNVIQNIKEKQKKHFQTLNEISKFYKNNMEDLKKVEANAKQERKETSNFTIINGDCVEQTTKLATNSVDLCVFSPPFAELYVYSNSPNDMGNVKDYNEFEKHFGYLVPQLARVIKQGRICAVHCMDLPIQKGKEGYIGLRDFSGMLIKLFQDNGFVYHSRVTIWKNPVTEMQRTKALGLLHKQVKKDSSMSRVGIPDYILVFRNGGENETQIKNTEISVDTWQKYASPIWYDIDYSRTLNYREAKGIEDVKHICPLQLDTIERIIQLYSNKNEVVLSPFAGVGSEGYQSLKMSRKFVGIELKKEYYQKAIKNLENANKEKAQLELV